MLALTIAARAISTRSVPAGTQSDRRMVQPVSAAHVALRQNAQRGILCQVPSQSSATLRATRTVATRFALCRRRATNPAIQNPTWLAALQAESLTTLCVLDTWSADKAEDRAIVTHISNQPYEEIERSLRYLAELDDAPVLKIGEVWKAKSPLELFDLLAGRILRWRALLAFFGSMAPTTTRAAGRHYRRARCFGDHPRGQSGSVCTAAEGANRGRPRSTTGCPAACLSAAFLIC